MNKSKNIVALTLMVSSIVLLLVLQLFWLQSSYERAFYGLRRDSNFVFRNTLYAMRDSLYQGNIRPVGTPDSLIRLQGRDIQSINIVKNVQDTGITKSSTVQIFISDKSGNKDSLIDAIRPMTRHLRQGIEAGQKSFFIRLAPDTVNLDTLKLYFDAALQKADVKLRFTIEHQVTDPEKFHMFRGRPDSNNNDTNEGQAHVYSDTIHLEGLRFNPVSRYTASIFPIQSFILRQIAPQILFSFLLTIITIIAFVILYRNVRTQQRLMELKNDFISNVTHELKTPVATVSVALEALKNFHALNDPKLTNEYLDIARNELNRLTLMTDKILKAAVFESKGITIQKETVDLHKTIAQILDSMRLVLEKRQALISFNPEGENFTLEGENAHITNVIYNLLDNALKYSPSHPVITIGLKEASDKLIMTIKDEGLGIPGEYKNKIFEKFFRVPTGDIHNIKGYGLGLSYVAGVVKAHRGSIEVESESGKGSTFIIHWPKHHA